ncbi:hypothetical protein ACRAWD_07815 [Caulobacter segnis]
MAGARVPVNARRDRREGQRQPVLKSEQIMLAGLGAGLEGEAPGARCSRAASASKSASIAQNITSTSYISLAVGQVADLAGAHVPGRA